MAGFVGGSVGGGGGGGSINRSSTTAAQGRRRSRQNEGLPLRQPRKLKGESKAAYKARLDQWRKDALSLAALIRSNPSLAAEFY